MRWMLATTVSSLGLFAAAGAEGYDAARWLERFGHVPPALGAHWSTYADAARHFRLTPFSTGEFAPRPDGGGKVQFTTAFTMTPRVSGPQVVRVSLPGGGGNLRGMGTATLRAENGARVVAQERVLTVRDGGDGFRSGRSMLTFVHDFPDARPLRFTPDWSEAVAQASSETVPGWPLDVVAGNLALRMDAGEISLSRDGVALWRARPIVPPLAGAEHARVERIEQGPQYTWLRVLLPDAEWPRIVDVQFDAGGNAAIRVDVQRNGAEGAAPDLGWEITAADWTAVAVSPGPGQPPWAGDAIKAAGEGARRYFAMRTRDSVPHQRAAWRSAGVALTLHGAPRPAWDPDAPGIRAHPARVDPNDHGFAEPELAAWPLLAEVLRFHYAAMATASAAHPDHGNVSGMPASGAYGMNRLNHAPAIFHAARRTGEAAIRDVALRWCANFHDLSIWWGEERPEEFGGTRYNNRAAMGQGFAQDPAFMWRSDSAVHFCTKGYDAFLMAYEETGDPRFATALRWQVDYASRMVHADQGEARNIGDVLDFVRLYELTGREDYLDQGSRLFRELRSRLSEGDLFSQGGQPIVPDPPFVDDDAQGYGHPFAKPYILGYALAGLPALARHAPEEPKLRDVIRAVAEFMAASQDPVGGWRYPHPDSSRVIIDQGMEHAAQLARAAAYLEARGEDIDALLDAMGRALSARVLGYARSGQFLAGLTGWEHSTGALKEGETLQDRYARPGDRDRSRDYTEGSIGVGGASPEGAVYFPEVLAFYLKRRPAERLFHPTPELAAVLARLDIAPGSHAAREATETAEYPGHGMAAQLPHFAASRVAAMDFPLRYAPDRFPDFDAWRAEARATLLRCLQTPPTRAEFAPVEIAREDRGTYEARKIVLSVSGEARVPAYLLVPKGPGPHPAVLALHDHGARFSIGKEKVVRPFGVDAEVVADAEEWVAGSYGGRFFGDALAARGYVVLAVDALFWGERGRKEGVDYTAQETLSANLLQLGMSWSGVITWDDVRSAEFLASLPEVDPARIGAMGLSMGAHRTWMLAAATDRVKAGVAIGWMGDTPTLMAPGNNQTKGQSAHSMLVPGLRNFLDYPDVASIACPKAMLFYNGMRDPLFPVPGVQAAFGIMRGVWQSQGADHRLETRLWDVPHEFNVEMQEAAFDWLEKVMAR